MRYRRLLPFVCGVCKEPTTPLGQLVGTQVQASCRKDA
jgi:hypothetical protein